MLFWGFWSGAWLLNLLRWIHEEMQKPCAATVVIISPDFSAADADVYISLWGADKPSLRGLYICIYQTLYRAYYVPDTVPSTLEVLTHLLPPSAMK